MNFDFEIKKKRKQIGKQITLRLDEDLTVRIDALAKNAGVSATELIHQMVIYMTAKCEQKNASQNKKE